MLLPREGLSYKPFLTFERAVFAPGKADPKEGVKDAAQYILHSRTAEGRSCAKAKKAHGPLSSSFRHSRQRPADAARGHDAFPNASCATFNTATEGARATTYRKKSGTHWPRSGAAEGFDC